MNGLLAAVSVPDINEEANGGSEMGKSCYTLHFDGVHLLEGVVETASSQLQVAIKSRQDVGTYIPGVSMT